MECSRFGALTGDLRSIIIQNTYMLFSTLLLLLLTANGIAIAIIIGITSIIIIVVVAVVVVAAAAAAAAAAAYRCAGLERLSICRFPAFSTSFQTNLVIGD